MGDFKEIGISTTGHCNEERSSGQDDGENQTSEWLRSKRRSLTWQGSDPIASRETHLVTSPAKKRRASREPSPPEDTDEEVPSLELALEQCLAEGLGTLESPHHEKGGSRSRKRMADVCSLESVCFLWSSR